VGKLKNNENVFKIIISMQGPFKTTQRPISKFFQHPYILTNEANANREVHSVKSGKQSFAKGKAR
jgi:hypothetical protein